MKAFSRSINPELLSFWYDYAAPGRIGLIQIDVVTARLINWVERRVTPSGEPSPWAHVFFFIRPRHGVPWIAESDMNVPLPGFRPKPSGPQKNLIYKWSHPGINRAAILDPGLSALQVEDLEKIIRRLLNAGYTYRVSELAEAWIAMVKQDLTYRGPLYHSDSMHCSHFVRECLRLIGCDPLGASVSPENTVPELIAQAFPVVAEWCAPFTPPSVK
ncbi:hypothetical protein EHM69_01585 [candidate division KSB1 bacterium]|nr:MAG: hypothetical protein EHM69_01585 [candidate division KSB1 bacterium]